MGAEPLRQRVAAILGNCADSGLLQDIQSNLILFLAHARAVLAQSGVIPPLVTLLQSNTDATIVQAADAVYQLVFDGAYHNILCSSY